VRPPRDRSETSRQHPRGAGQRCWHRDSVTARSHWQAASTRARNPRSPSPSPASPLASPVCPRMPVGMGPGVPSPIWAGTGPGDRGSLPIPIIPDLPGTGMDPRPDSHRAWGFCALESTSATDQGLAVPTVLQPEPPAAAGAACRRSVPMRADAAASAA
jgi:hypothetical protein